MATRKSRNFLGTRNRVLVLIAVLLLLAGGVWAIRAHNQPAKSGDKTPEGGTSVNLNPPTEEEKQQTEAHKGQISQPSQPAAASNSGKKQVTPIITNASQEQINAYVPGVFEEGGSCAATLTKGNKTVTKTSTGFQNVSYTSCAPINISGQLTERGTWSLVLSYNSTTAEGKSATTSLEVH